MRRRRPSQRAWADHWGRHREAVAAEGFWLPAAEAGAGRRGRALRARGRGARGFLLVGLRVHQVPG